MSTKTKSPDSLSGVKFSKNFSTSDLYKQYTDAGKSDVEAIKIVAKAFDDFCKETKDVDYLIDRYAELYNHKKVITPLAFSLITISTSVGINIGYDIIKDMLYDKNISQSIIGSIMFVLIALMVVGTFAWIFKTMQKTYTPYDIFVLSYERKRLYEELTKRGYIVEKIEG